MFYQCVCPCSRSQAAKTRNGEFVLLQRDLRNSIDHFVSYDVKNFARSFTNIRIQIRQRFHGSGSFWNRYEIGTDEVCVYTGPGGSGTDRICYLVPNESTYEGDPMWNRTVPV